MIALLTGWMGKVWGYVLVIGAIIAAVIGVLAKVFGAGKTAAREEGQRQQLENVATRNKVDAAVDHSSDDAVRERLRREWSGG